MEEQKNTNICVICQTEIDTSKSDDNVFIECLHCFHKECWDMYRIHNAKNNQLKCPICQTVQSEAVTITIEPIIVIAQRVSSPSNHHTHRGCCCLDRKSTIQCLIIIFVVFIIILITMIIQQQNK
jgi:hypothetical protein